MRVGGKRRRRGVGGGQAVRGSDDGMVARRRRELKSDREVRLVLGSLAHALLPAGNRLAGRRVYLTGGNRSGSGLGRYQTSPNSKFKFEFKKMKNS